MKTIIELREEAIKEDKNVEFYLYQMVEEKNKQLDKYNSILNEIKKKHFQLKVHLANYLCIDGYIGGSRTKNMLDEIDKLLGETNEIKRF